MKHQLKGQMSTKRHDVHTQFENPSIVAIFTGDEGTDKHSYSTDTFPQ
jgi:hypothetical protein